MAISPMHKSAPARPILLVAIHFMLKVFALLTALWWHL